MLCLAIMYISQILEQGQTMSDFAFWKKTNNEILVYRFCFEISHNSDFFILNIENIVLFEKILSFGDIAKVFIRLWILDVLKQSVGFLVRIVSQFLCLCQRWIWEGKEVLFMFLYIMVNEYTFHLSHIPSHS